MTNYREIERLRKDPRGALRLAKSLLAASEGWSVDEEAFLEDVVRIKAPRAIKDGVVHPLTTRQIEWLVDLRDGIKEYATTDNGFSVERLIEQTWQARLDLDDDNQIKFLDSVRGQKTLKKRQLGLLLHIARKLGAIEQYA